MNDMSDVEGLRKDNLPVDRNTIMSLNIMKDDDILQQQTSNANSSNKSKQVGQIIETLSGYVPIYLKHWILLYRSTFTV